jgi:hypothetical protein
MTRKRLICLVLALSLGGCTLGDGRPGTGTHGPISGPPTEWQLAPAADPDAPTILGEVDGRFGLRPEWQVLSIEFLYKWWGLGEPVLNHQIIERKGVEYKLGETSIAQADVQALVRALSSLYPTQMELGGYAGTDNYPSWAVELTGIDGQHMLLTSASTGNPGKGPWNILHNGRLYAQYDGSLAAPLGKLFKSEEGEPLASYSPGGREPGKVVFSSQGLPRQLLYGFWGLLAISDGFSYTADATKTEIRGQIIGSSRIGSMKIGQIKTLARLQLSAGNEEVSCQVNLLPEGDPWTATTAWEFTCPLKGVNEGDRYRYPVKAIFGKEGGGSIEVDGGLWGTWHAASNQNYVLLPPPPEIEVALAEHPMAKVLLQDHILGGTRYSATLNGDAPLEGTRQGEAILFGQTKFGDRTVRYTIGAQMRIEDGKLTYWDLDRKAVSEAVGRIVGLPLTQRVLGSDPRAVINIWHAAGAPSGEKSTTLDYGMDAYGVQVNSCGTIPGGAFPTVGKPLQAFDFNSYPYFPDYGRVPFVLIDGQAVVSDLVLFPAQEDPARQVLLPDNLDVGTAKPFERIYMETAPYSGGGPTLSLAVPANATTDERAVYEKVLKALPAAATAEESQMVLRGAGLAVKSDGNLEVVTCSAGTTKSPTAKGSSGGAPPRLAYSTYYGSTDETEDHSTSADALAIDQSGNAYITGMTSSSKLHLQNPLDSSHSGSLWDAFVAKLDTNNSSLPYATYITSGDETTGDGIAVDAEGNIYITGSTFSGFRVQNSPIQTSVRGIEDAYVIKLSGDGTKVIYATLLGGAAHDVGLRITADKEGNAYVVGATESADFHTERPLQANYGGKSDEGRDGDAFVAKISPDGQKLIYSTYLGGKSADAAYGIAVDEQGNAYVAGYTLSEDFPMSHPLQPKAKGGGDAFVTKISPDGASLVYSTYLGGGNGGVALGGRAAELGANIVVDGAGNAFVVGTTGSPDFPLVGALSSRFNGGVSFSGDADGVLDAFIAKLNPQGSALLYSTYLGGSGEDRGRGIGLDGAGNIYVGGSTTSPDFPLERPLQKEYSDIQIGIAPDSFITKLNPTGSSLLYSTYFGVDGFDALLDFAVDKAGAVYIAGSVDSPSPGFPLSSKPFQNTNSGIRSAFVAKITDER